ncbi:uncharacterized protein WCC33_002840 [Rhinophrynus dorsalis]
MFRRIPLEEARRHQPCPTTSKRPREESDCQDPPEAPKIKRDRIKEEERQIDKRLEFQRLLGLSLPSDMTWVSLTLFVLFLVENKYIHEFLIQDIELSSSDKYLLAMVQCYFHRAGLSTGEYTMDNFFAALSLAIGMEEDQHNQRTLSFWSALSRIQHRKKRDHLLTRMDYRGYVSKEECDQIMAEDPDHWAWKRDRKGEESDSYSNSSMILEESSDSVLELSIIVVELSDRESDSSNILVESSDSESDSSFILVESSDSDSNSAIILVESSDSDSDSVIILD